MNGGLPDGVKDAIKDSKSLDLEGTDIQNEDKGIQKSKLVTTSNSSLSSTKAPLCQVQVSSTENLKSVDNDVAKNDFIKPEEAMAWLIRPIDTAKFFKYVFCINGETFVSCSCYFQQHIYGMFC